MDWTTVDVPESTTEQTGKGSSVSGRVMEALVRVTAAGFAGALVGLSYQRKASGAKIFQRSVLASGKRKFPPKMAPKLRSAQEDTNFPIQWAASFGAFVAILETSHFWSPSTIAMNIYAIDQDNLIVVDELSEEKGSASRKEEFTTEHASQQPMDAVLSDSTTNTTTTTITNIPTLETEKLFGPYRQPLATIMDYTLGGAVAGLAGGLSKRRPTPTSSSTSSLELPAAILKTSRRSIIMSGIGTGVILGFIAGICQAGFDIAEDYARAELARQEEEASIARQQRLEKYDEAKASGAAVEKK